MSDLKQAFLVILASVNGRDGWFPVKPEDLPDWVIAPETMGRIVAGDVCMKCDDGRDGSLWYRKATTDDFVSLALHDWAARERAARVVH
jgi:hypothetical protein